MSPSVARRLVAIAALACFPCTAIARPTPIQVTLTPRIEQDTLRAVQVELRWTSAPTARESHVRLPGEWGGQSALHRAMRAVSAPLVDLTYASDSSVLVLHHAPGALLVLRYEIVQDVPGTPQAGRENPYRPIVQPGYFHLIGNAVFVQPDQPGDTPVEFHWGAMPAGWRCASDLEHADGRHPLTLDGLQESIVVGGDFRVVTRHHARGDLRVVLRGHWSFGDDSLADRVDRIVQANRRFWSDPDEPFLVTVLPLEGGKGSSSLGGTGRGDAFAFFATDNAQEATLNRVLAHEHLHTWIPRRVGRLPVTDEPSAYWFSEGFTDFYTFRLLVREGLWSIEDFVVATNEVLMKYAQSPARTAPNARVAEGFWSDPDVQDLPYQRGFLLASLWDAALRRRSGGRADLDDVLARMKRRAAAARDSVPYATALFAACAHEAGLDLSAELQRFVERGEAVAWPADLFGPGLGVETAELAEFSRGFDGAGTAAAGGIVTGCDPAGPAYAAGLRDGMKILERKSGKPGDSRVELVYRVMDGAQERVIRFMPQGTRRFVAQQLVLAPAHDRAARARVTQLIAGRR